MLPRLATDPLHEDEVEDVDIREARRERAAAVIWKRSCSERGDGPGMGGRGRDGGREGGGFGAVGMPWGMKVGGTGNSLSRTGTVVRVCFTAERVMVDERERERAKNGGGVSVCTGARVSVCLKVEKEW